MAFPAFDALPRKRATCSVHRPLHDHQRDLQPERRALARSRAGHLDRAAMHLDELTGDRKAQAEASSLARHPGVRLPEALEHVRQELRRYPDAGVADRDFHMRVDALEPDLDLAAAIRELDRIRQQVPQHLLETLGI